MTAPSGWRLLVGGLRGQRRALGGVTAWSVVEALPALLTGQILALALDRGFLAGRPLVGIGWLGALLAAMLLGAGATRMVYPHLAALVEPLRDGLVRRLVHSSVHAPGHRSGGADPAAVSRLTDQVETVRRLVSGLLRTARQFGISIIATIAGVAVLAPVLTLVVVPPLVVSLLLFAVLLPRLAGRERAVVLAGEEVARSSTGLLHGMRDVRACQATGRAAREVGTVIDRQARASRELARVSSLRVLLVSVGVHIPLVALLAAGPFLVGGGHVSAGELVAAVGYLNVTLEPALRALIQTAATWGLQLAVVLRRLAETIEPIEPAARRGSAGGPDDEPAGGPAGEDITLVTRGLTFAYGAHTEPVIRDLDLRIPYGEHLAVVGPSGVGKSTLADLLTGLATPSGGKVQLGGRPLASWDPARLRRTIALIPQEAYLFTGTVRENVAYLNPTVPDRELDEVARTLGATALVDRLGGWDGALRAADLAAGERQLLALARVCASPAPIVILDEAGCYLDPRAEARAEAALRNRGGTLVVIAHRVSSALRADRVLVLDGRGATIGTHEALLDESALYADLVGYWSRQPHRQVTAGKLAGSDLAGCDLSTGADGFSTGSAIPG